MSKYPGFTFEEHEAFGRELRDMRNKISKALCDIGKKYGVSHKAVKRIEDVLHKIEQLRSTLDDVVGIENPEKSPKELNAIYYGTPK